jgi:hypothetical protein
VLGAPVANAEDCNSKEHDQAEKDEISDQKEVEIINLVRQRGGPLRK